MQIRLSEGLIYSSLVGAKCSTSLKQQDNLLELRPYVFPGVGWRRGHTELVGLRAGPGATELPSSPAGISRCEDEMGADSARGRSVDDQRLPRLLTKSAGNKPKRIRLR